MTKPYGRPEGQPAAYTADSGSKDASDVRKSENHSAAAGAAAPVLALGRTAKFTFW